MLSKFRRNLDRSKAQLAHRSSTVPWHLSSVMHITLVTKYHLFHVRRCMLQSNQPHTLPSTCQWQQSWHN